MDNWIMWLAVIGGLCVGVNFDLIFSPGRAILGLVGYYAAVTAVYWHSITGG